MYNTPFPWHGKYPQVTYVYQMYQLWESSVNCKSLVGTSYFLCGCWIQFISTHNAKKCSIYPKCTLVQALRLSTSHMAHRRSRGIASPFHDHGTRRGWGVSVTPRLLYTPGKDPVPIVQEAGWAPGPVWRGAENLAPTGTRSPHHSACSQSLHLLRYLLHIYPNRFCLILTFRHRASCILGQAFRYSPENAFYIFNQQIYFIIWYLLDRASLT